MKKRPKLFRYAATANGLAVPTIEMGNANVTFCESASNLGVMFNQAFHMEAHMKSVCCSTYFQLLTISKMIPQLQNDRLMPLSLHNWTPGAASYLDSPMC